MGYVGLPLASAFSRKFKVLGYDVDKNRISQLKAGIDITSEIKNLKKNNKNLQFYYDIKHLKNCKIFVVTVPTPVKKNNEPDLSNLKKACKTLATVISKKSIIVFEMTVYPVVQKSFVCQLYKNILN